MDENLVGYALKALEPDEQAAVESHLDAHPEARAKLEMLERALAPLAADADDSELPSGLAMATLARIAEHKCRPLPPAPRAPRGQFAPSNWPRVRPADVLAAAVILIIAAGVTLPAVLFARQQVERTNCQNNLRTIWAALQE
jgi:anti-sigma factor RsiW